MRLNENIESICETRGISRKQLIERSGVSKSQMARILTGSQNNPTIETIVAIATALNCSLDQLVYGEENESSLFMQKAMERLPEERKDFIKQMIRMAIMVSSAEEVDKI
ncbi:MULTISPECIES: helix-turn-helix domain-containing protein [Vibrionaceae]|uniref:Helix-turn-helix transcriptional regulator n=1 Tax=Vibrio neptunius TaxID=170651 RepID=A0ABS3AB90_9VIBR|nr:MULTISPECIES: helix-turn-helix transcriptional regulator [Vibrionaceae]MBN3495856.1 helix-turn-helix transcriptional regulator [Vibrio neptunius]MBN3518272.1 helix-turn-helix transcriptional regulator [Vibrio neptunius]MBN3552607.1 helix-turn-helix transcriptional regulator [Vibrio neptunius]MBN3580664.1 helix-turn-helix transcriptional regulator [Vibrio neptunius]MCH9874330.1 helix-turn-helix transcriptional regulator [Vibrio neptunius]